MRTLAQIYHPEIFDVQVSKRYIGLGCYKRPVCANCDMLIYGEPIVYENIAKTSKTVFCHPACVGEFYGPRD